MRVMFDSVDPAAFPDPTKVPFDVTAGYVNGRWLSSSGIKARFPNLPHLSITVTAAGDADCADIETGDLTPADAPGWLDRQYARGLAAPVLYCNTSTIAAVRAAVGSRPFQWWSAGYFSNRVPRLDVGAVATQWTDKGPNGENVDQSQISDDFYAYLQGDRMARTLTDDDVKAIVDAVFARRFPKQGSTDTTSLGDLVVWSEPVVVREVDRAVKAVSAIPKPVAPPTAAEVADELARRLGS